MITYFWIADRARDHMGVWETTHLTYAGKARGGRIAAMEAEARLGEGLREDQRVFSYGPVVDHDN